MFFLTKYFFFQFSNYTQNDLELVCCSGYGKNGSLTILQVNKQNNYISFESISTEQKSPFVDKAFLYYNIFREVSNHKL